MGIESNAVDPTTNQNVTPPQGQPTTAVASGSAPLAPTAPTQQPAPQATAQETLPQGMTWGSDGKVQVLSSAAYKRLKDEARERGGREALESTAKENGYKSVEEMLSALKPRQTPPAERPAVREANAGSEQEPESKTVRALHKERETYRKELDQLRRQYDRETSKRKELQETIDAREAEMVLRESAIRTGVTDVDYALRLLTRSLEGKSDDELSKFEETKFFDGLKGSHPYLFREVSRPATTGTGTGSAPAGLKPEEAAQAAASNGRTDARNMKQDDFRKLLQARGLNVSM